MSDTDRVLEPRLRRQLTIIGAAVTALAAAAGWFVARRTAAPVARLTVAAERVATTGDLDADLPEGGPKTRPDACRPPSRRCWSGWRRRVPNSSAWCRTPATSSAPR